MSIVPLHVPINEIDNYFYNRREDLKKNRVLPKLIGT